MKSELEDLTLGYFDYDRFYVILGNHKDTDQISITFFHELQHQRLNAESTYGLLLKRIADEVNNYPQNKNLNDLFKKMVHKCLYVHEMQATYISLLDYDELENTDKLPKSYQDCLSKMNSMLVHIPQSKQWRLITSWTLCWIAMLTCPYKVDKINENTIAELNKFIDNPSHSPVDRILLIYDVMQDFHYNELINSIKNWGMSDELIAAFEYYDEPDQIQLALGIDDDWDIIFKNWRIAVMDSFLNLFEKYLSGIDDARGTVALTQGAEILKRSKSSFVVLNNIEALRFNEYIRVCNLRVSYFKKESIKCHIFTGNDEYITSDELYSFNRNKTIYFSYLIDNNKTNSIHVVDCVNNIVTHFITSEINMALSTNSIVSIIEIETKYKVWTKKFLNSLVRESYLGDTFIYCNLNPLLVIENLIKERVKIKWFMASLNYSDETIEPYWVQVFYYWISDFPYPIFHLSYYIASEFLKSCYDEIDTKWLKEITDPSEINKRIEPTVFSKLVDHPNFLYYLSGTNTIEALKNRKQLH